MIHCIKNEYIPYRVLVDEVIDESISLDTDNLNRISSLLFFQWVGVLEQKGLAHSTFTEGIIAIRDYLQNLMQDIELLQCHIAAMDYITSEDLERLQGLRIAQEKTDEVEEYFELIESIGFSSIMHEKEKVEEKQCLLRLSKFLDNLIDIRNALIDSNIELTEFELKIIDFIHEINIVQHNFEHRVLKRLPSLIIDGNFEGITRLLLLHEWSRFFIEQLSLLIGSKYDAYGQLKFLQQNDFASDFDFTSLPKFADLDLLEMIDF